MYNLPMRSLAVLVLFGALLALLAGCAVEGPVDEDAQSDQLDIEVGRRDYINGADVPEPKSESVPE